MIKIRRIVCPTDFSPTASRAVEYAASLARVFRAELTLLHVLPGPDPIALRGLGSESLPRLHKELRKRAVEQLRVVRSELGRRINAHSELLEGDAYAQILECANAHKADIVVMGTHGHTGLMHALLGSTAERVVRLSRCPVLTVRVGAGRDDPPARPVAKRRKKSASTRAR